MTLHKITRNLGRFFGFVALLAAFRASSNAQVLAHTGDVAGAVGWSNLTGVDGSKHINFGGEAAVNLSPGVSVFGEYLFLPLGSIPASQVVSGVTGSASVNNQQFGGGARFNFGGSAAIVPYAVAAFGYSREGANATVTYQGSTGSGSAALNGDYVGFGGGANIYFGRGFGVRPEFRYERQEFYASGASAGQNVALVTGSFFYQFGGQSKKVKSTNASSYR